MTPEEIQRYAELAKMTGVAERLNGLATLALWELAAQLAEQNELTRKQMEILTARAEIALPPHSKLHELSERLTALEKFARGEV